MILNQGLCQGNLFELPVFQICRVKGFSFTNGLVPRAFQVSGMNFSASIWFDK